LARALEANQRWERLAAEFREENAGLRADNAQLRADNAQLRVENVGLRERDAQREAEFERVSAELAVLTRLVFGRSSERAAGGESAGSESAGGGDEGGGEPAAGGGSVGSRPRRRGRAGDKRRGFSEMPPGGGGSGLAQ